MVHRLWLRRHDGLLIKMIFTKSNKILTDAGKLRGCCCETPPEYGPDCEHCEPGKTPKYVTISFDGLTDCGCTSEGGSESYLFEGVAAALNGKSFLIPQVVGFGNSCYWYNEGYPTGIAGTYGTGKRWINSGSCAGAPSVSWTNQAIWVCIERCISLEVENGISAYVIVGHPDAVPLYREYSGIVFDNCDFPSEVCAAEEITDCMGAVLTNAIIDCSYMQTACYGGTMTIVEGDHT